MLARYTIVRGKRKPEHGAYPTDEIIQDTRHRWSHCLRPNKSMVDKYLENPTEKAWSVFKKEYLVLCNTLAICSDWCW